MRNGVGGRPLNWVVRQHQVKPVAPPIIETERLLLRIPRESDIADIFEYASDDAVTRLMDWKRVSGSDEVRAFLARTSDSWGNGREYTWVVTERGIDRVIGAVALRSRESDSDFGYVLNRKVWGRGIALEASRAITALLASAQQPHRIWATCDVENYRSARVLEKLGLKRERVLIAHTIRPNISSEPRDSYLYANIDAA